jgi:hypothetical protein
MSSIGADSNDPRHLTVHRHSGHGWIVDPRIFHCLPHGPADSLDLMLGILLNDTGFRLMQP